MKSFRIRCLAKCASVLLGVIVVLASTAASAQVADKNALPGLSVGLTMGYGGFLYDGIYDSVGERDSIGEQGYEAGVRIGYTKRFADYFAGLDVYFVKNFATAKTSLTDSHIDRTYGIDGRFGYLMDKTVAPYLLLGYSKVRAQFSEGNDRKTIDGIKSGIGLEYWVTPQFSLRPEVTYTYFNRALPDSGTSLAAHKVDLLLSLSYYPFADKEIGKDVTILSDNEVSYTGSYIGAIADYSILDISSDSSVSGGNNNGFEGLAIHGAGFGGLFGYGLQIGALSRYYVAAEGEYLKDGAREKITSLTVKVLHRYGVSIIGGYIFDKNLIYGKVGFKRTHIGGGGFSTKKVNGLAIAIGLEKPVSKNIFIRGEFEQTRNHKFSISEKGGWNGVRLNNNSLRLSVLYRL